MVRSEGDDFQAGNHLEVTYIRRGNAIAKLQRCNPD
jgi:hypothetical protein